MVKARPFCVIRFYYRCAAIRGNSDVDGLGIVVGELMAELKVEPVFKAGGGWCRFT